MKGETKLRQRNRREAEVSLGLRPVGKVSGFSCFLSPFCLSVCLETRSQYVPLAGLEFTDSPLLLYSKCILLYSAK